jgi:hypothetical protein
LTASATGRTSPKGSELNREEANHHEYSRHDARSPEKLDAYTAEIGKINGVKHVAQTFNVTPTVAQSLELRVQEARTS